MARPGFDLDARDVPPPRPEMPRCPRCGIHPDLRQTRAHRRCIRAQRRADRAVARERERLARAWMTRVH